jgi:hypothetical protein
MIEFKSAASLTMEDLVQRRFPVELDLHLIKFIMLPTIELHLNGSAVAKALF